MRLSRAMMPLARTMTASRAASSLVSKIEESISVLPMREAMRYTNKNLKWTASEFKHYTDSHANALLEHGFEKGETIAVWLADSAEKHVTFLAAAKIGLKIVDVDASGVTTVQDLRQVLSAAACKAIFFEPVTATQDNLLLLRKAIPEFFAYDDTYGQSFHSKHFPALKYFVHTGFDLEMGCLNYKHLFLPNPEVSYVDASAAATSDELPLYSKMVKGASGAWEAKAPLPHAKVLEEGAWTFAKKIISKEYFEQA